MDLHPQRQLLDGLAFADFVDNLHICVMIAAVIFGDQYRDEFQGFSPFAEVDAGCQTVAPVALSIYSRPFPVARSVGMALLCAVKLRRGWRSLAAFVAITAFLMDLSKRC